MGAGACMGGAQELKKRNIANIDNNNFKYSKHYSSDLIILGQIALDGLNVSF